MLLFLSILFNNSHTESAKFVHEWCTNPDLTIQNTLYPGSNDFQTEWKTKKLWKISKFVHECCTDSDLAIQDLLYPGSNNFSTVCKVKNYEVSASKV